MITASELPPRNRMMALVEGVNVVDMTRLLVTKGADVNAKSSAGMSALMVAAVHNNPSVIGVLAQLGADLSARDGQPTARELAVLNDNRQPHKFLMCSPPRAPNRNAPIRPRVLKEKLSKSTG